MLPAHGVPAAAAAPGGEGEIDNLGEIPPDCGAVHKDYTDPSCTAQTRNGTFSLSPHVVHAGGTITGTISNRCKRHETRPLNEPPDADCATDWTQMLALGKKVSGCQPKSLTCSVAIPKTHATQKYSLVVVGITSDQGTGISKDYYAVLGKDRFVLAGHVTNAGQAMPKVTVTITGPKGTKKRVTDLGGAYNAVLPRGRYTVAAQHDAVRPVRTKDCQAAEREKTCHVYLIQDRTADFEVSLPELTFRAKLGAMVHSTERHQLIEAGTPFLIDVTLRNNTRDKRLLVFPIYAELSGNASDGHLQQAGLSVRKFTPDGSIDEVRPSPFLVLQPKQTRSFDVVVRTSASDALAEEGLSAAGGTEAVVKFAPPHLAAIKKDADLSKLTQADLELLDPGKAIEMTEGSDSFKVGIDDAAPATPAFDYLTATWYVTKGVVIGLWRATWGSCAASSTTSRG